MYHVNDLLTFVSVAKTGGVGSAAKAQGISAATVSHRVTKLEEVLNLKLFHRNSRKVQLTEEGLIFLDRIEPLLADLRDAELEAGSGSGALRGHLRVTLSPWILSRFIMPVMSTFQAEHPDLTVEFLAVDRYVALVDEGIDCAIRVGQMADSTLKARKLSDNDRIICASPVFCETYGLPTTAEDLRLMRWACLPWQTRLDIMDGHGAAQFSIPRGIAVSNSDMLTEAAVQGLGLAVKSRLAVQRELESGALVEVMPGVLRSPDAPISFVHAGNATPGRKVRAFSDLANRAFQ
ncbi:MULTISPECIES: LysR family transcriptional regulator [unclassified Ruegeria]|uniref:LysR family transcriptional regulator n=1 Tax=unclassified Ruegeria TaxID=2625375 RepID=UPI001ADD22FE|nr:MULTISPECIES: LysR family transcriptional regulator [unclassified Ruegeria]MBO9412250.1 LysR family transcriptional regulator [Ruegeria sp. R8_1]MBO9417444.1 LysR family transcriptional regulator [Ruegeria sp. R8_2]